MNLLQRLPPSTFQVSIPMLLVLVTMSFGVYRAIEDASAALSSYVSPRPGAGVAPPQYIIDEHLLSQQALRAPAEPQREGRRQPDPDPC